MDKNILCSGYGKLGPTYGGYMVTADVDGVFKIWIEDNDTPIIINLDGDVKKYKSLASTPLDVSIFADAPINKYGLKEIAKYEDEVLTLTANGLLVVYSGGLPSLKGLPSDVGTVSGVWIGEDGLIYAYPFSLNQESDLASSLRNIQYISFYKKINTTTPTLYKVTYADSHFLDDSFLHDCDYFMDSFRTSRYSHLYSGFTKASISSYNTIVKRRKYELGPSLELKPIILDGAFRRDFISSRVENEYTYSEY